MAEIGCDRTRLRAPRRAGRSINDGSHARAEALIKQAIVRGRRVSATRVVAAGLLELVSRAQWSLGRAEDARASVNRALELLPEDEAR